jgi:putative addiction module component (TIGR02574 family)
MPGVEEIIKEAESLPVEKRAIIVDSLLRTLNPPNSKIDRKWVELAKRRLTELRSGRVKPVPGDMVFAKIRKQFDE